MVNFTKKLLTDEIVNIENEFLVNGAKATIQREPSNIVQAGERLLSVFWNNTQNAMEEMINDFNDKLDKTGGNVDSLTVDNSPVRTVANYGDMYPTDLTASATLITAMANKNVNVNSASAVVLTVDVGVYKRGDIVNFERQGAGTVTFLPGIGFTLNSAPDNTKRAIKDRYALVTLKFNSSTNATLIGSLE